MRKIDPLEYFKEKANNIFLWVVLVLNDLGRAKTTSDFTRKLNGFSEASGSMEKLYEKILQRVEKQDRKWIREILMWLIDGARSVQR